MAQAPAPYTYILEQPAPKSLRFRYECEGRSAGSIPGVNSTQDNKTFPTIKICGYKGCMVIVVSCVTKDEPYKPHPHNLVGRDCQMGVCTVKVKTEGDSDSCQVQFKNLGIQCVKRRDIVDALRVRQELRVNPYKTGYAHRTQPQSIDLNAVRLCFQVFLTDDAYKVQRQLEPVASEVIYDKKAMSDLLIVRASHCSGPVKGGTTVILLCEKVTREDTEVWFFREENGLVVWSERGHIDFVHKQLAIVLKTPAYRDLHESEHVTVQFQLQRLSDGAKSNTFNFEYIPEVQDKDYFHHKKPKKLSYNLQEYNDKLLSELPIKAEPNRTPPHHLLNPGYQEQWQAEAARAYASQVSWSSPPYHAHSPALSSVPQVLSPDLHAHSPHERVGPSPGMHGGPSPGMHGGPSPGMHGGPSPGMHGGPSPGMHGGPSPGMHGGPSPGLHGHPTSPYNVHLMGTHMQQQQQPSGLHMQSLQVRSPLHAGASPAQSPGLLHTMPMPAMQPLCMPGTMDPVMAEVVQPTYTQMDATNNSTPSLATLLMNPCEEELQFNSGDLSNLSSMLNERGDLSDSLNRLSTRDLLQP